MQPYNSSCMPTVLAHPGEVTDTGRQNKWQHVWGHLLLLMLATFCMTGQLTSGMLNMRSTHSHGCA